MSQQTWSVPLRLFSCITPNDWYDPDSLVTIYVHKTIEGTMCRADDIIYIHFEIDQSKPGSYEANNDASIVVVSPQIGKTLKVFRGQGVARIHLNGHMDVRNVCKNLDDITFDTKDGKKLMYQKKGTY